MKPTKLAILTPMYGGTCSANYCVSVTDLARVLSLAGIAFDFFTLSNESLVQRARNVLFNQARRDPETTHILMVDADIGFDPQDVIRLLALQVDFVCGAYSRKSIEWERIRTAARAGVGDLGAHASSTFVHGLEGLVELGQVRDQQLVEIKRAGTGFMLLRASVLDQMERSGLLASYKNRQEVLSANYVAKGDRLTAFFHCPIDSGEDDLISEDYYFCDMWRKTGGVIWLAPWVRLSHWGTWSFR